ncbi:MAG: choice-of-anchor V domain-containing protein [Bacteroidota bacterium]
MNNKAKISISVFAMLIGSIVIAEFSSPATGNTIGAPGAKTGSPGDGSSCTASGCHAGTATNQAGLITSTIPSSGYIPGQTYTVTGSITTSGKTRFGFEMSPQNLAGALKGSLILTNTTHTQLVGGGKYITHKLAGTSFPSGTATWSFDWTAPAAGSGDLTFYGAFNSTNNSGTTSGDLVTLSSLAVTEDVLAGISESVNNVSNSISVYPNPVSDKLYFKNSLKEKALNVSIIDVNGKLVKKIDGIQENEYMDMENIENGYYLLRIETANGMAVKKIVKK